MSKIFSCELENIKLVSSNKRTKPIIRRINGKQVPIQIPTPEYDECKRLLKSIFFLGKENEPGDKNTEYKIDFKFKTYKDKSNCVKVVEDALVEAGVIFDDRKNITGKVEKEHRKRGSLDYLKVTVWVI